MNITIRHENTDDYRKTEEVARDAFWNLYMPGASEHVVVHKMRNHKDFIKELNFVIEVDNKIAGAIMYTKSQIICEDKNIDTISFGPVFISPKYHRMGLGRKLITHSIDEAINLGYEVITTLGYPYHYEPYGFRGGKKYNVSMPDNNFYKGLLVLPLKENVLDDISGYAVFSEALEVSEKEIEEFDATFGYKEKKVLACQKEYEIACVELDI